MDLSKLPRLSETKPAGQDSAGVQDPAPAPGPMPVGPAAGNQFCTRCGAALTPGTRFCGSCGSPVGGGIAYAGAPGPLEAGIGAEVWISAVLGVIFMLVGHTFARYLVAMLSGQTFHTEVIWSAGEKAGSEVAYWELMGYTAYTDSAMFLFGLAMVLEAGVLLIAYSRIRRKLPLVGFALLISAAATGYNLFVAAKLLTNSGPLPLMSLLAAGIGGYIAVWEWRLIQQLRTARS